MITQLCFANHPPEKTALILIDSAQNARSWSYGELFEKIKKLSAGLRKLQLKPFSRILIRSENSFDFFLLYFAAMHASLVPCALDPSMMLHELLFAIEEARASLYYEAAEVALHPVLPKYCRELTHADLEDLKQFEVREDTVVIQPDDPGFMVFTAGSATKPKGVVHAHRSIIARESLRKNWLDLRETDRLFHTGSHHLAYTMCVNFFDVWRRGATAISFVGRVNPLQTLEIIEKCEVSILASIPTFYKEMVRLPENIRENFLRSTLRLAISAEEPLAAIVQKEWERIFRVPLLQGFTLTEMHLSLAESLFFPRKYGSIGKITGESGIKILPVEENEQRPVALGERGVLAVSIDDEGFMLGTVRKEENEASFRGKWYVTGDIVSVDEEGYVWHYGRKGDVLKTVGAVRISAKEIEEVFKHHHYVSEVAAVTTLNEQGEEVLTLFVVPYQVEEEEDLLERRLVAYAKHELSCVKIPERIVFLEHLPKNPNGSIDRCALHAM